ncbi:hypothetical protein AAE478_004153 [Parahypoxylon ruwenzoriense]
MWIDNSNSWRLSEFKGLCIPTENILLLSSTFSIIVSVILETILLLVLRNKSKHTKKWLRYTLFTILSLNALLAFVAFLSSISNGRFSDGGQSSTPSSQTPDGSRCQNMSNILRWSYTHYAHEGSQGAPCGQRVASRWLSLLISVFSIIIMISAWLDFREEDRRETQILALSEGRCDEKRSISLV